MKTKLAIILALSVIAISATSCGSINADATYEKDNVIYRVGVSSAK